MEQYLEQCLEEAVNQTIDSKEIICIDDGSTDCSVTIVLRYQAKYPFIRLYQQERKGAGAARNLGIVIAAGEYISFMDADDYYPDRNVLEQLYGGAMLNGTKIAGGRIAALRENVLIGPGKGIGKVDRTAFENEGVIEYKNYQDFVGYQAFIYQRSMLIEKGILFPNYSRFQDPPFMLRALDSAGYIWITNSNSYVFRYVDKTLDLSSVGVIMGIAEGLYELAAYARKKNYEIVLKRVLDMLNDYKNQFFMHIEAGNDELFKLLHSIGQLYFEKERDENYYLNMSYEEIVAYINKYKKKISDLLDSLKEYPGVLIYGGGKHARMLFQAIDGDEKISFKGFVVSNSKPDGTACGIKLGSIYDYTDHISDYLIVIAAQDHYIPEMRENAKKLGYQNIIAAGENIINPGKFKISNNRFAIK